MNSLTLHSCDQKTLVLALPHGASRLQLDMSQNDQQSHPKDVGSIYNELLSTDLFSIYRSAFERVTGQTLALLHPDITSTPEAEADRCKNAFCSLMLESKVCEERCIDHAFDISKRIDQQALTTSCEANISSTLIPINSTIGTVAYLRSGQVRTNDKPIDAAFFQQVTDQLPHQVAKDLLSLYDNAKVYQKDDYHSQLTLLGAFALQLAELSNNLLQRKMSQSGGLVESTKRFIHEKLSEKISLDTLAQHVNVTNSYLCKQFKKATGLTVVEYINRHRVELAKELLTSKNIRIIEIAYETGFQSLSQFNRSFHRYTGQSPTEFKNKSLSELAN